MHDLDETARHPEHIADDLSKHRLMALAVIMRAGEQLSAGRSIDAVLAERLARALHDATMDLTLDDHRVQHHADIVDGGVCDESQLAGIRIDLDLGDMTAARKG